VSLLTKLKTISTDPEFSLLSPIGGEDELVKYFRMLSGSLEATENSSVRRTLELALRDALPVPPDGVAFDDILEFKQGRTDELSQLTNAIEGLSVQLSGAETLEDAVRVGKQTVDSALTELDRVFSEKWTSRLRSSLRMGFTPVVSAAIGGGLTSTLTAELSLIGTAALTAGAPPLIEAVVKSFATTSAVPERAKPYLYAYQAGQVLKPKV